MPVESFSPILIITIQKKYGIFFKRIIRLFFGILSSLNFQNQNLKKVIFTRVELMLQLDHTQGFLTVITLQIDATIG